MTDNKTSDTHTSISQGDPFAPLRDMHIGVASRALGTLRALWQRHVNRRTAVLLLVLLSVVYGGYTRFVAPPERFPIGELVTVPEGAHVGKIAQTLADSGVIRSERAFIVASRILGVADSLQAEDYLFSEKLSMFKVLERIVNGVTGLTPVKVRMREGDTAADLAKVLEKKLMRFDKTKFLSIAEQREGFLFPDTYYFMPNATEEQIVGAMVDNFHEHFKELEDDARKTGLTKHELVTLASIVELEAFNYTDRRKIAGVLYNRLDKGMALQVDVSFIYIMNKGTFQITRKDLRHDSPYNTYKHKGLPPGPICSPSLQSLKAAVYPLGREHGWLFYLADKHGVTHYSATYKEHLRKKRLYIDSRR